jgi:hypothetical protein
MRVRAGIVAVAALAYALCDFLHEFGHLAATHLPLGVKAVSISTIAVTTSSSSPVVAAAGPLVNLLLSLSLLLALVPALSPVWRYFAWLLGTVNLFNGTGYLLYSAVLGTGDWAVVFDAVASPSIWRPIVGFAGLAGYVGCVYISLRTLRRLVTSGVIAEANVDRYCSYSYWVGGLLLTLGAVFNPTSPWFILTSGAATGFGAMIGLLLLPPLLRRTSQGGMPASESLLITTPWVVAGAVAAAVFICVLGPGLRLA